MQPSAFGLRQSRPAHVNGSQRLGRLLCFLFKFADGKASSFFLSTILLAGGKLSDTHLGLPHPVLALGMMLLPLL